MRKVLWLGPKESSGCRDDRPERLLFVMVRFLIVLLLGVVGLSGAPRAEDDPGDAAVVVPMVKQALEFERTGTDLRWSNPETGSGGVIRVERTYYRDANTPCRDYIRTTKRPGGEEFTTRGTGCRMSDGRWFLDETPGDPAPKAPPAAAGAPAGRKDDTVVAAPPAALKTEAPATPAPVSPSTAEAPWSDDPGDVAAPEADAPVPPRVKPKVLAPDYKMPSKSAL